MCIRVLTQRLLKPVRSFVSPVAVFQFYLTWPEMRKSEVIPSSVHSGSSFCRELESGVQLFFTEWIQSISLLSH